MNYMYNILNNYFPGRVSEITFNFNAVYYECILSTIYGGDSDLDDVYYNICSVRESKQARSIENQ